MFRKSTLILAGFAMVAALSRPVRAETIDTFSFSETGWGEYTPGAGITPSDPATVLTGTFTAVVEPDGFIDESDLNQFSDQFESPNFSPYDLAQQDLTLFSYDPNSGGGASSLDFAGTAGAFTNACLGAATSLDLSCEFLNQPQPPGTIGTVLLDFGNRDFVSSSLPEITLVSSETTSAAPEPSSIILGCIGLAVIAILRRRRQFAQRRLCLAIPPQD